MKSSIAAGDIEKYLIDLVRNYLPDEYARSLKSIPRIENILSRVEHCFSKVNDRYFQENGRPVFDHMNSDHMAMFLYFVSNTIWEHERDHDLAVRFFYLNKILHGVNIYYTVKLPEVFLLVHPIGTVLGHAEYGNYFAVYQGCTVGGGGGRKKGIYPKISEKVILYSKSGIIGDCRIGRGTVFSANSNVVNSNIQPNTIVSGQYPEHRQHPSNGKEIEKFFFC